MRNFWRACFTFVVIFLDYGEPPLGTALWHCTTVEAPRLVLCAPAWTDACAWHGGLAALPTAGASSEALSRIRPTLLPGPPLAPAALMLVVMTFNIGIILAVCGGFAIGALLFGHAGERAAAAPLPRAPAPPRRPLAGSASSEEDLEAVFVEGPGCCSGGTASAHLSSTA